MIIESSDKVMVRGRAVGTATAEAVLTAYNGLIRAKAKGTSSAEGTLKHIKPLSGLAEGTSSAWAFLRLDGGPNHFLSGIAAGSSSATATMTRRAKPHAKAVGTSSATGTLTYFPAPMASLSILVDVFPENYSRVQRIRSRLIVDGDPVPVESFQVSRDANNLSATLNVTLADIDDRTKIIPGAEIVFDLGIWDGTDWIWETLLDLGKANSTNYVFSRERDTFSFVGIPKEQARLAQTPVRDLVIYDSLRETLSSADFEPIPDSEGNLYTTELVAVPGLTVHALFQRIFVNRIGFSEVKTNLPDWRVTRADFQAGVSFMATIGGITGMFSPDFHILGDTLWITDGTAGIPNGFPAAREITLSDSAGLEIASEIDDLNAVLLSYSSDRSNYDYPITRTETDISEDLSNPNWQQTRTVTRTIKEYFRAENPFTPIDQDIMSIEEELMVSVPGQGSFVIFTAVEDYTFDGTGNPKKRVRTEHRRLPDIRMPIPDTNPQQYVTTLLESKRITEEWRYKANPFRPGSKYQSSHTVIEEALICIDEANRRLGEPYREGYAEAYQGGNLTDGMGVTVSPIRSFVEKTTPLRDGRAKVERTEVDILNQVTNFSESQTTVGEISMNGRVREQRQMYVFKDGLSARTTEKVMQLNGGEVPLNILIPLARRVLTQRQQRNQTLSDRLAVVDLSIAEGTFINPKGRNGEDLGNFVVTGRTITGNRDLVSVQIQAKRV